MGAEEITGGELDAGGVDVKVNDTWAGARLRVMTACPIGMGSYERLPRSEALTWGVFVFDLSTHIDCNSVMQFRFCNPKGTRID